MRCAFSPSGKTTHVDRIVTYDGDLDSATAGQSITLTLKDEVDCSRGQVITAASAPLEVADQFETTLIWMDEEALMPGRSYYLKIGAANRLCNGGGAQISDQRQYDGTCGGQNA
jgi:bifunctional enzyme CysN/CysC